MMKNPERVLVLLLRVSAVILLTALGAVIMPHAWMDSIHRQIGLGGLPHGPIIGYLTRSLSAMYAFHGALFWVVSSDVWRYLPVIRFLALGGIGFGLLMLGIDASVGLPVSWIVGEGPFIILEGLVVLWLCRATKRTQSPAWSLR